MPKNSSDKQGIQGGGAAQDTMPRGEMNQNRIGGAEGQPCHRNGGQNPSAGMGREAAEPFGGSNPYYQTPNGPANFPVQGNPYYEASGGSLFSSFNPTQMLTGALIGAAATYVLTNENVQKTFFKGIAAMSDIVGGGFEELKERYEDAKAEYEVGKSS